MQTCLNNNSLQTTNPIGLHRQAVSNPVYMLPRTPDTKSRTDMLQDLQPKVKVWDWLNRTTLTISTTTTKKVLKILHQSSFGWSPGIDGLPFEDLIAVSVVTFDMHHFTTDITYLECSCMQGFPQKVNLDLKQGCRLLGKIWIGLMRLLNGSWDGIIICL